MKKTTPRPRDLLSKGLQALSLLSPRELLGLKCLAALLILGLIWLFILGPIQQLWLNPNDERTRLSLEMQQLKLLQTQAKDIRAQTRMSTDEAKKALERITRNLLPQAQWTAREDAVQITLSATPASVLARWLQEVRESAQSTVLEANLNPSTPSITKESVLWQGVLVVGLPH